MSDSYKKYMSTPIPGGEIAAGIVEELSRQAITRPEPTEAEWLELIRQDHTKKQILLVRPYKHKRNRGDYEVFYDDMTVDIFQKCPHALGGPMVIWVGGRNYKNLPI